jgi:hypothetical protein
MKKQNWFIRNLDRFAIKAKLKQFFIRPKVKQALITVACVLVAIFVYEKWIGPAIDKISEDEKDYVNMTGYFIFWSILVLILLLIIIFKKT